MKLAIVIHTQSGRTSELAKAIAARFRTAGHDVDISMLRTFGAVSPGTTKFELKSPPAIDGYDGVIFGGPVWAFKASPVIMKFLGSLKNLKNKKCLNFVTKGLPFNWTGGNQAIKNMNSELETSNGDLLEGEIVHMFFKVNKQMLNEVADRIYGKFAAQ